MHLRIRITPEVVTVFHEHRAAAIRRYLQAMPGQFEIPVDLGPQQAAHVGAVRVQPVLVKGAAGRRAADVVVFLDTQDIEAGLCEVRRVRQPVVACADNNRIVCFH